MLGSMNPTPLVSHESISQRARQIWEEAGHPDGCETAHWLQAERELHAQRGKTGEADGARGQPAGPPVAAKHVAPKAPHSTDYAHPGVTTDALHHRRR
jgi:hypothetical protein